MSRTARLLAIVLVLVLASVGAYVAYNVGFDNGAIAANVAENGSAVVVDRGYGWHGGFGFFPFFWIFPLLFFFLLVGAFRRGPSRWGPTTSRTCWGWTQCSMSLSTSMSRTAGTASTCQSR